MGELEPGLAGDLLAFAAAAAVTWVAGHRLTRDAKLLSDRTRVGQAFLGTLLMGVVVSLPELTMSATAAAMGHAALALNSLVGGVAMTMVMVAVTDLVSGPEPLSRDVAHPVVLLEAALVLVLATLAACGMIAGDVPVPGLGAGAWTTSLAATYVVGLLLVRRTEQRHPWRVEARDEPEEEPRVSRGPISPLLVGIAIAGTLVLAAGVGLAVSAEAIARELDVSLGLVGIVLGGVATSLPELSTTLAAARQGRYELAFSDAFGTNQCSLALLFLADLVYPREPLLDDAGLLPTLGVLMGALLTAIYLVGLVVRPRRSVLRMGPESVVVLIVAAAGFGVMWRVAW